ncbi:MAG: carbohydrate ABC transporter permease [Treponema sp.]|nr:carbohydrate ABC transporter permease [Treponema sp.]
MNKKLQKSIFLYAFSVVVAVFTLAPFIWMFITSVTYPKALTSLPLQLIPRQITFDRYINIFTGTGTSNPAYVFRVSMSNSIIVALCVTALSLIVGTLAAYAFARLRFRFKDSLILLTIFTYMIPPIVLILPMYTIFNSFGMVNTKPVLVILYLSIVIPFIVWVMQGFFVSLSKTYEEAAEIDGCNRFQTFYRIFLPIARPGLIATGLLAFLMSWDEFFFALIFTSNLDAKTITVAISEFNGKYSIDYGMISAAGVIASVVPMLIVLLFQRYIVTGMTAGGVKE